MNPFSRLYFFTKNINSVFFAFFKIITQKETLILFSAPKRSDILIFDSVVEDRIKAAILQDLDYTTCDTDYSSGCPFRLHITPRIICFAIVKFFSGLNIWSSYYYGLIRCISPKVLVDNIHYPFLLPLAQCLPDVQFFVILNGFHNDIIDRSIVHSHYHYAIAELFRSKPKKVQNFHIFCFGEKDADIFRQCGLNENKTGIFYHAVGSLFADFMKYLLRQELNRNDYDIIFVSQCANDSITGDLGFHRIMRENTRQVFRNLSRYMKEKNLRVKILLRSKSAGAEQMEIDFYRSMLDDSAKVDFSGTEALFSVYEGLTRAPIIISLFSTTCFEAMSWGKKALFCLYDFVKIYKISSDRYKADTDMLRWSLVDSGYPEFRDRLDDLIKIDLQRYRSNNQETVDYIISGKNGRPAHVYIRDMITSVLAEMESFPHYSCFNLNNSEAD